MNVGLVTGNYFKVMGLSPVLGRLLDDERRWHEVSPVMVLTYEYWMKRFGGDRDVVGREVRRRRQGGDDRRRRAARAVPSRSAWTRCSTW